jgi:hypothetical protein
VSHQTIMLPERQGRQRTRSHSGMAL